MSSKGIVLSAKNISKSYNGKQIFKDINLQLYKGKSIAILGASGSGKTTLLHILSTLDSSSTGDLNIHQQPITKKTDKAYIRNQHIGMIFQAYHLIEQLSPLDNILLPIKISRSSTKPKSTFYQRALTLLETLQILHLKDQQTSTLSGGEKQRVAIARALINNPSIVFADEPTGNLDNKNTQLIQGLLFDLCSKYEKNLVIVTHNQTVASFADERYHLVNNTLCNG